MGLRFRRSKKIGPLNITASSGGIGVSVGVKGARVGIGADGKVRSSVGIPGTGLSYQQTHSDGGSSHQSAGSGVSWRGLAIVLGIATLLGLLGIGSCVALIASQKADAPAPTSPPSPPSAAATKPSPPRPPRPAPLASGRR
jgi:hypothetical protein